MVEFSDDPFGVVEFISAAACRANVDQTCYNLFPAYAVRAMAEILVHIRLLVIRDG